MVVIQGSFIPKNIKEGPKNNCGRSRQMVTFQVSLFIDFINTVKLQGEYPCDLSALLPLYDLV